jgi:hypothetical protein
MCTMIVKEVISFYTYHNSNVFCIFSDVSKAFDKVHFCELFSLLMRRNYTRFIEHVH